MKRITTIALLVTAHLSFAMDNDQIYYDQLKKELLDDLPISNNTTARRPERAILRDTLVEFKTNLDGNLWGIKVKTDQQTYPVTQGTPVSHQSVPTQPVTPTQQVPATPPALSIAPLIMAQAYATANNNNDNNNNNAQKSPIGSIRSPIRKTRSHKELPSPSTSPIVLPAGCYLITGPGIYACFFCKKQFNQHDLTEHSCSVVKQIAHLNNKNDN